MVCVLVCGYVCFELSHNCLWQPRIPLHCCLQHFPAHSPKLPSITPDHWHITRCHCYTSAVSAQPSAYVIWFVIQLLCQTGCVHVVQVLSDELDEGYFHHRHLRLRQHLQKLATAATLSVTPEQGAQSSLWEECCSMPLSERQVQAMLQAWAIERGKVVHGQHPEQNVPQLVASWEQEIRVHCGCGECTWQHRASFWRTSSLRPVVGALPHSSAQEIPC